MEIFYYLSWANYWRIQETVDIVSEWLNGNLSIEKSPISFCWRQNKKFNSWLDAFGKAYFKVIYTRSVSHDGKIIGNILTSKTKVTSFKTMSIPGFKLCLAIILANLISMVWNHLNFKENEVFAFTDSRIELALLSSEPHRWQLLQLIVLLANSDPSCTS